MTIPVAVIGAKGRMGQQVCQAVDDAGDMELIAALDQGDDLNGLPPTAVAVEFTTPTVTKANVLALLERGLHVVVGTTGWSPADLNEVRQMLSNCPGQGVVIAPNYALSAVLAMHFAKQAAKYFTSAEVIELHHPAKLDAPSGTAVATAHAIAQARAAAGLGPVPDATIHDAGGARGAEVAGIHVHAVRLPGLVAHEEILFGNAGEALTIRTDSFERTSFMPGVLLGIRQIITRPGLTWGLEPLLEL